MDSPLPSSLSITADTNKVKTLTKKYVQEIKRRLSNPRADFKTESNDLFGFNGSNIDIDIYGKIYHKHQQEMGLSMNIIQLFDNWMLKKMAKQIVGRTKELEDGTVRRFDNVVIVPPSMVERSSNLDKNNYPPSTQDLLELIVGENKAPMFPRDAINSKKSYSVKVYVDIYTDPEGLTNDDDKKTFRHKLFKHQEIGEIPILKGSHFCWLKGLTDEEKAKYDECFNDPLGYFIVNGAEKASLPKQHRAANQMLVDIDVKKGVPRIFMYCLTSISSFLVDIKVDPKKNYVFRTNFHQAEDIPTFMIFLTLKLLIDDQYPKRKSLTDYASDFFMNELLPLIKSFIEEEDQERASYTVLSSISEAINKVQEIVTDSPDENPRELILGYIKSHDPEKIVSSRRSAARMESKDLIRKIRDSIFGSIVVNDPTDSSDFELRILMLAKMTSVIARVLAGVRPIDDRDSWANNRVHSAGREHENMFTTHWNAELNDWKISSTVNSSNPGTKINPKKITNGFAKDLVSGVQKVNGRRGQVTDAMKRETPMTVYSNLHRVTIPDAENVSKLDVPRQVHPSQLGFICSGETPEGPSCGRVKHLASTCWIAIPREVSDVVPTFEEFLSSTREDLSQIPLMLDGIIQGWVYPQECYQTIWKRIKTSKLIFDVCCTYNRLDNHIDIFTTGDRLSRPLFVVDQDTGFLKLDQYSDKDIESMSIIDMTEAGIIEFVHANELEMYLDQEPYEIVTEDGITHDAVWVKNNNYHKVIKIAEYPQDVARLAENHEAGLELEKQPFTHAEIVAHGQFGIPASCIPAASLNHGPRIIYQSSMSKQALSGFHSVHRERYDGTIKRQIAPTRTFFETRTYQPVGLNAMPSSDTPVVAILSHPINNEDSIVVKKEFLDQHFLIAKYTCYKIKIESDRDRREEIGMTPEAEEDRYGINKALWKSTDPGVNPDMIGLPKVGMYVDKNEAHLGRIRIEADKDTDEQVRKYAPSTTGMGKEGFIDRVEVIRDASNILTVKIKVVQYRRQIAGDKMASRYSQKGTYGKVIPANRLPRIASGPNKGVIPDIFINPICIPGRMTQGKIVELLLGKAVAYTGEKIDASPFSQLRIPYYQNILAKNGLDITGAEEMVHYDGVPLQNVDLDGNVTKTLVYVGLCAYQSLKHHVIDKFQKRDVKQFNPLTHQPAAGRINEGGLKFGEMEHDATVSHGTTEITADRLLHASDKYRVIICVNCGNIAISNFEPSKTRCQFCSKNKFGLIEITFISHLIIRMFNAIGIHVHLMVK